MNKVQANLIPKLMSGKHVKTGVLLALQANLENGNVYLPNAYDCLKGFITKNQFAGYLSALAREGKYAPCDDGEHFGFWGKLL